VISKEDSERIIDKGLAYGKSKADGLEIQVEASSVATSRFANNSMTQNQSPSSVSVSVRAVAGGKQTRLSADKISPADVEKLIDDAIKVTTLLHKDPNLLPLLSPEEITAAGNSLSGVKGSPGSIGASEPSLDRFDAGIASASPDERANRVNSIIEIAREHKLNAAGTVATGEWALASGNSEGVRQYYRGSRLECSLTMCAEHSTGWAKEQSPIAKDLNIQAMARRAAEKAVASANPIAVDPGHYTVILEPSAVLDLCGGLWYDFTGTSFEDKQSCFLDKRGKQVLGKNITIYDDVYHPLQDGEPFDGEGLPRQKVCLVENGVIKNLVYGRRSAKKFNVQPTGHGLAEPNAMGEYPQNIVIEGGNTSLDEMIRGTDRGILLTRVWYVREVDPTTKIVTGMTRDGTFLVENGKIKCGVKNLRFNESLIEMLNRVEALGPAVRAAGEESFPAVVPAMKVAYFNFESSTKF
jgi:predicted Zn-dependent protease